MKQKKSDNRKNANFLNSEEVYKGEKERRKIYQSSLHLYSTFGTFILLTPFIKPHKTDILKVIAVSQDNMLF